MRGDIWYISKFNIQYISNVSHINTLLFLLLLWSVSCQLVTICEISLLPNITVINIYNYVFRYLKRDNLIPLRMPFYMLCRSQTSTHMGHEIMQLQQLIFMNVSYILRNLTQHIITYIYEILIYFLKNTRLVENRLPE